MLFLNTSVPCLSVFTFGWALLSILPCLLLNHVYFWSKRNQQSFVFNLFPCGGQGNKNHMINLQKCLFGVKSTYCFSYSHITNGLLRTSFTALFNTKDEVNLMRKCISVSTNKKWTTRTYQISVVPQCTRRRQTDRMSLVKKERWSAGKKWIDSLW